MQKYLVNSKKSCTFAAVLRVVCAHDSKIIY